MPCPIRLGLENMSFGAVMLRIWPGCYPLFKFLPIERKKKKKGGNCESIHTLITEESPDSCFLFCWAVSCRCCEALYFQYSLLSHCALLRSASLQGVKQCTSTAKLECGLQSRMQWAPYIGFFIQSTADLQDLVLKHVAQHTSAFLFQSKCFLNCVRALVHAHECVVCLMKSWWLDLQGWQGQR